MLDAFLGRDVDRLLAAATEHHRHLNGWSPPCPQVAASSNPADS